MKAQQKLARDIVFKDITTDEVTHITKFDSNLIPDFRAVIGFFSQTIMRELRLISGYDVLYGKVKEFIQNNLFEQEVELEDLNVIRNLSELEARKTVVETFKKEINVLTVRDKGEAEIKDYIKISKCRPFIVKEQGYILPRKSAFNKILGDSHFELQFATFLEDYPDIVSYAKNYFAVNFKIDYQDASGFISNYYPDFIVKVSDKETFIVETKGREDLDDSKKFERLKQWCTDINKLQSETHWTALYVKQEDYEKYKAKSFLELLKTIQ